MFRKIFGEIREEYKTGLPAQITDYATSKAYQQLGKIYSELQRLRGYHQLVGAKELSPCDIYIPAINTVVELDESQHFSLARKQSLLCYPAQLRVGFDKNKWIDLCDRIHSKDNNPPHRDEQRAWYDTLRDFLPNLSGLNPTIRIFMADFPWCSLDPNKSENVEQFQRRIEMRRIVSNRSGSQVSSELKIATVTIASKGRFDNDTRMLMLQRVLDRFGEAADLFLTPAGFFSTEGAASMQIEAFADRISALLGERQHPVTVCFGIDGRNMRDQLAGAVNARGVVAIGRKFFPAPAEEQDGRVECASDHLQGELGYPRIFNVSGHRLYLAVCYDSFGIRKRNLNNPKVNLILNPAHAFHPRGESGSGDVYFAKYGFAGSSRQWQCPTMGTAVFMDRKIPPNWPCAVLWNQSDKGVQGWSYTDNQLGPEMTMELACEDEKALVRVYKF